MPARQAAAGGTSGTGAGGTSGTGAGGTSGAGGSGGTGGRGNQPITCGHQDLSAGRARIHSGRAASTNTTCGIDPPELTVDGGDLPCTEVDQPGNPDPSCFADSGIDLSDSGFDAAEFDAADLLDAGRYQIQGCCRPNGMCGIIVNFPMVGLNLGCVDPNAYGQLFDAGAPQACTPRGGNVDASAGG